MTGKNYIHQPPKFESISLLPLNRSKTTLYIVLVSLLLTVAIGGCGQTEKSDAYGQFEADETTISAEASGSLLRFDVEEGYNLEKGQRVGLIDTTRIRLKIDQLRAKLASIKTKIANVNAQIEVQREELELVQKNLQRIRDMVKDSAATEQKLDEARTRVNTIKKKIRSLEAQKQTIRANAHAQRAQIALTRNQLEEASVENPIRGTVLTTFAEPHEVVRQGEPLYSIANLDTMILRVYVSGAQLPDITLNQEVQVLVDKNKTENQRLQGRVSWIASEAEFTPQQIQTKEERVTQVYAVKIRVPNPDGTLKIGMPGEVNFSTES